MNTFAEIIKRRSMPGLLIFNGEQDLLFFNDDALHIISLFSDLPAGTKTLKCGLIPREIFSLCNKLNGKDRKNDDLSGNSNCAIMNLNGNPEFFYSVRACFLNGSGKDHKQNIMVLLEQITDKRVIDLQGIKGKYNLTDREADVLELICKGFSNKDISRELFITEATVKVHLKNIMLKMRAASRCEIIARSLAQ